jgi:uncharacterized protein involved in type VI secretion and phage assembly
MNEVAMPDAIKLYGKYRGTVVNNIDPLSIGRIQAIVPDVSRGALKSWAMPCVPVAGVQMGVDVLPPVGANVWIEFERGDADHPIWTGGFWAKAGDLPAHGAAVSAITVQTVGQNGLTISDVPGPSGGLTLKSGSGATIVVNDAGIVIQNGKGASIVMVGPSVTINQGALEIT